MAATEILVRDYDLAATLDSGQVFRWQRVANSWRGVLGQHFIRLTQTGNTIHAATAAPENKYSNIKSHPMIHAMNSPIVA